ncbi:hypothetical protein ThesuDRAFT_01389 [Thermaerobacter subterraneus DSM 13965]|uniref:Thioesterase domain-containing protein n=1 Tax=Thermaerobacter subterraneus DSM 13965 TaxID=867903 RepID=K6PRR1_9FIRM|nr:hypothetical protein ThesuDRAFT_01389 [Thermaerobacter subterraneus DSM 13965]
MTEAWEEHCGRRTALYRLEVRRAADGRLVTAGQGRVFRQGEEGDGARPQEDRPRGEVR